MFASISSLIFVGLIIAIVLLTPPKRVSLDKMPTKVLAKMLFSFWVVFGVAHLMLKPTAINLVLANLVYTATMIALIGLGILGYIHIAKKTQVDPFLRLILATAFGFVGALGAIFSFLAPAAVAWVYGGNTSMAVISIMGLITLGYLLIKERDFVEQKTPDYPDIPLMTQFNDRVFQKTNLR